MKDTAAPAVDQQRLVRPRRETPKWNRLSRLLDEIHTQADNEAIYAGFVHGDTKRLDAALERIQKAATEARAILRPNTSTQVGPEALTCRACSARRISE